MKAYAKRKGEEIKVKISAKAAEERALNEAADQARRTALYEALKKEFGES